MTSLEALYQFLSPTTIQLAPLYSKQVDRSYKISVRAEKQGAHDETYRKLRVKILLSPHSFRQTEYIYNYYLFAQKLQKKKAAPRF